MISKRYYLLTIIFIGFSSGMHKMVLSQSILCLASWKIFKELFFFLAISSTQL